MPFSSDIKTTLDRPELASIRIFLRQLRGLCVAGEAVPKRSALDPVWLGEHRLLDKVWIVEPVGSTFGYRLSGEQINQAFGRSVRGLTLLDVMDVETAQILTARWHGCMSRQQPYLSTDTVVGPSGWRYSGSRVVVPLLDDAGTPGFIMGLTLYGARTRIETTALASVVADEGPLFFRLEEVSPEV